MAVVDRVTNGVAYIIQAEARGVTNDKTLESVSPGGTYTLVEPPTHVDRNAMLEFARNEVGSKYGWLSILSAVFDIVTPDWLPSVRRDDSWICSAVTAEALRTGGWVYRWPDIYCVTPAQLFNAVMSDGGSIPSN